MSRARGRPTLLGLAAAFALVASPRGGLAQEIRLTGPLAGSTGPSVRLPPRDTAAPVGRWSVGVVDPLRIALSEDVELSAHPLLFLVLTPNAELKVRTARAERWTFASTVGLSVPTVAMRLAQGTLFPTWDKDGGRVGWFVVPSVGLLATRALRGGRDALTLGLESAIGVQIGSNDARPVDGWAPLEIAFGPALHGTRVHAHVTEDVAVVPTVRARIGLDVWFLGRRTPEPEKSPWILGARGGLDVGLTAHTRLAVGFVAFSYDNHRTEVRKDEAGRWQRVRVRSSDVWPTLDLLWVY